MKKLWITALLTTLFMGVNFLAYAQYKEKEVKLSEMPPSVQEFIATHFADEDVMRARIVERGFYKVELGDGYVVEFDRKSNWVEIENNHHVALPASVVALLPQPAVNYIGENYKGWTVYSIERRKQDYEVKLHGTKKVELHFDSNGNYLRHKEDK